MAKITDDDRERYTERTERYRARIAASLEREQALLKQIEKNPEQAAQNRLILAEEMINAAAYYIVLSGVSQSMLDFKNEDALNDARGTIVKALIYLEELVSPLVDAPFADYEDKLDALKAANVNAARRYLIVKKLGLAVRLLENAYGDNTKWRWTFVEIEGRYAAVIKNLLDLRTAVENTDPRALDYEPTVRHIALTGRVLAQTADRYREMYELSTNRLADFKTAVSFLAALRRFYTVLSDQKNAESVKKKLDIWNAKLEADEKKQKAEAEAQKKIGGAAR